MQDPYEGLFAPDGLPPVRSNNEQIAFDARDTQRAIVDPGQIQNRPPEDIISDGAWASRGEA